MTVFILIPAAIAVLVLVVILYRGVMVRRRTSEERHESPDQIR